MENHSTGTCEGCGKMEAAKLCPICLKSGVKAYFCSQDCFKSSFKAHKVKHTTGSIDSSKTNTPSTPKSHPQKEKHHPTDQDVEMEDATQEDSTIKRTTKKKRKKKSNSSSNLSSSSNSIETSVPSTPPTPLIVSAPPSPAINHSAVSSNNNHIISMVPLEEPIHSVPIVIMEQIFGYLSPAELQICAFVCKRWKIVYESFWEKEEERILKNEKIPWFSVTDKSAVENLQRKIEEEWEFSQPGTFHVHQIDRSIFLFSLRTDTASVFHVKIEHDHGKWQPLEFPKVTAKFALPQVIRDLIEELVPTDKGFISVQNENEISANSPYLPRVTLDGCVHSFTDKVLISALKKNSYIRALHFTGKEWLKEGGGTDVSWALSCLLDNFSITGSTFQYAGPQVAKAKNIGLRNERFTPILRVFDLCNNNPSLQLWCYQSLVNHFGARVVDQVALHFACARGMTELVEVLLNKGVPPFGPIPETEETPFMFALRNHHLGIIKLFEKFLHKGEPLIGWCGEIERGAAEKLLQGQPVGTFLTRYSPRAGSYVVSLQCEKDIQHLAGWKRSDDGSVTAERQGGKYRYYANLVEAIYDEMIDLRYPMKSPIPFVEAWKDPKSTK